MFRSLFFQLREFIELFKLGRRSEKSSRRVYDNLESIYDEHRAYEKRKAKEERILKLKYSCERARAQDIVARLLVEHKQVLASDDLAIAIVSKEEYEIVKANMKTLKKISNLYIDPDYDGICDRYVIRLRVSF